jgi:diguanylate cyclase (GGDEF)-like protein/PAS domain S-box-containing protein
LGYSTTDLLGKPAEVFIAEASRLNHRQQVGHFLNGDANAQVDRGVWEVNAQRRDGVQFPVELVMSAMRVGSRRHYIALMRDITERKAVLDDLHHVANHDALTGLYNRRYFISELERWLALVRRGHHPAAALMFIDLDWFKSINDRFGHAAGDVVLRQVSQRMRKRARSSDIVARMGGDEFAMLLHDVTPESAQRLGESFREELSAYRYHQGTETAQVGCSIGIAMFDAQAGSIEEVLAHADQACYGAKRAGRNAVRMFNVPRNPVASGKIVPIK